MADPLEVSETEQLEIQPSESRFSPLHLILDHYWLLILGAVAGCVVAALYYARATPIFQSSAQVLVVKKTPDGLPANTGGSGALPTEDYLSTHQTLIRSPLILGAAVQQADLASLPTFAGIDPTGVISNSLKLAQEMNANKPTNVLNISFRCSNAEDAAAVVTAIVESYKQFLKDRYQSGAEESVNLITQANELLEQKLSKQQREYDEFLAQHPYLWRGVDGLNPIQERIFSLEAKRSALIMQDADIQGKLAAIAKSLKDGKYTRAELLAMNSTAPISPMTPMSPMSPMTMMTQTSQASGGSAGAGPLVMEERLMALEQIEKKLLVEYGPDYPEVRSIHEELAKLRTRIKRSGADSENDDSGDLVPMKTPIQVLKLELENTRMAAETLSKVILEEQRKARPLRLIEKRDELYRMEIARTQQLFEALAKRLDEISILKNFTSGYDAELISPPGVGEKVAPKALLVFPIGLVLGLLAGFGLAYLAEISDQSFRTPEEIRRRLGLPVVGHIPFFAAHDKDNLLPADGPQVDPCLCTMDRPKSRESEAFRGIRTALFFNNREGDCSLIQVTSPDKGDGKSTLISNLAVSIAQAEKKVILVDADFRRPRLHKLFKLSADRGLASVMIGEAELNDVIQQSPIPGLSLLPCGPIPPNPAELLTLPRFKELLAYLREKYDYVLIDTPPLLAVTDPGVVVPNMDGVLLAIRMSKNAHSNASRAKEILSTLGARVIGVVVNGGGADANGYGYGGYRYGYYKYNYHDYTTYESDDSSSPDAEGGEGRLTDGAMDTAKKQRSASRRSSRKKTGFFTWLFDR